MKTRGTPSTSLTGPVPNCGDETSRGRKRARLRPIEAFDLTTEAQCGAGGGPSVVVRCVLSYPLSVLRCSSAGDGRGRLSGPSGFWGPASTFLRSPHVIFRTSHTWPARRGWSRSRDVVGDRLRGAHHLLPRRAVVSLRKSAREPLDRDREAVRFCPDAKIDHEQRTRTTGRKARNQQRMTEHA